LSKSAPQIFEKLTNSLRAPQSLRAANNIFDHKIHWLYLFEIYLLVGFSGNEDNLGTLPPVFVPPNSFQEFVVNVKALCVQLQLEQLFL